jgi:hypothetical protein
MGMTLQDDSARSLPAGPGLRELIARARHHVLLLGVPRSGKDHLVRMLVKYCEGEEPLRIRLQELKMDPVWLERKVAEVAKLAEEALRRGRTHLWVHLSNLEAQMDTLQGRSTLLELIEALMLREVKGAKVRLAITSSVDPVQHFADLLQEESRKVEESPHPEQELNRWALVLSNFDRCHAEPDTAAPSFPRLSEPVQRVLRTECRGHVALYATAQDLDKEWSDPDVTEGMAMERFGEKAAAFYHLMWSSCTRPEKLLLVQLAQTGVVNPRSAPTLKETIRKGLVKLEPAPAIFNRTFQEFLKSVERPEVVEVWEREAGQGIWFQVGRVSVLVLWIAAIFFVATQERSMELLVPILTGSGVLSLTKAGHFLTRLAGKPGGSGDGGTEA